MFDTPVLVAFWSHSRGRSGDRHRQRGHIPHEPTTNPRVLAWGLAFAAGAMVFVSLVEIFGKAQRSFGDIYGEKGGLTAALIAFIRGHRACARARPPCAQPSSLTDATNPGNDTAKVARVAMLAAVAITAHNFPEGLATFFATLDNPAVGASLAVAIAIHNIPEASRSPCRSITPPAADEATLAATASGFAEPVGALIGYVILQPFMSPFVYGSIFGLVAGVMVFLSRMNCCRRPSVTPKATKRSTVWCWAWPSWRSASVLFKV